MIDKKPAVLARRRGAAAVMAGIDFACETALLLAVSCGGHNAAGNAMRGSGLVIDLSAMKSVCVDPAAKVGRVEPSATMANLDHETQACHPRRL